MGMQTRKEGKNMNIYHIYYKTNSQTPNQIQIETIPCKETPKSYCWPGTRFSKLNINIIKSYSYHTSSVSLSVYSTSLDILDTFKKQIQITLLHNQKQLQKELVLSIQNLNTFINTYDDQKIDPNSTFSPVYRWYEPCEYDVFDDSVGDDLD